MKATIVDLRYRMRDVLKALDRNEEVAVLRHGKLKGVLRPARTPTARRVRDHPFFGMRRRGKSVEAVMNDLRGGRQRGL
jgi:hypothetical protein